MQVTLPSGSSVPPVPLCGDNALGSASCEYVLYGDWSLVNLDYTCCSHGFSDLIATVGVDASLPQCDENANHSPYSLAVGSAIFVPSSGNTFVSLNVGYQADTCDSSDPLNAGCCGSDLKAVFLELPSAISVVGVATTPDVSPTFAALSSGINVTAGFGAGSNLKLTLTVSGQVTAADVCPEGPGCNYRLYGGASYSTPFSCCPTDYLWASS